MTSLYCLDISMSAGRAFFDSPTALPKCKTWKARSPWDTPEYASYFLELENWFLDELSVFKPDIVGFESPVIGSFGAGRGSDENNLRRLIGAVTVIELACAREAIPCHEAHVQTCKAFMGIPGRRPQDMTVGQYKDLMTIAMSRRGFACADSHQADAVAVALVVYSDLGLIDE